MLSHRIKRAGIFWGVLLLFFVMATDGYAQRRRRPTAVNEQATGVRVFQSTSGTGNIRQGIVTEAPKPVVITEDMVSDLLKQYRLSVQQKRFLDALGIIEKVPTSKIPIAFKTEIAFLKKLEQVELRAVKANAVINRDSEMEEPLKKQVDRLLREAQFALLGGNNEIAKDVLIHIIFLTGQNVRARYLLEDMLYLKSDAYKIENMESKYWKRSETGFYGGNYQQSVDALQVLTVLDSENPMVFERLGSSYYMMAEREKALAAWNTAVFLSPENAELKEMVSQLEKVVEQDKIEAKKNRQTIKKAAQTPVGETIVLGKFTSQEKAYEFAAQAKKQGAKPTISEEDGKWVVRGPKP